MNGPESVQTGGWSGLQKGTKRPSADTNFSNEHQEAYFRSLKNYKQFAQVNAGREETIYVGANDGMLHAFKSNNGVERWAFVRRALWRQRDRSASGGAGGAAGGALAPSTVISIQRLHLL